MDDLFDGVGGVIGLAIICTAIVVIFVFGILLLPVVAVVVFGLWYFHNSYLPAKNAAAAEERTVTMVQAAGRIAPKDDEFIARLVRSGVKDETLLDVALSLYKMEGLAPPPPPPPLADSIEGARYRDQLLKYVESADQNRFEGFVERLISILKSLQMPTGSGIFESRSRRTPEQIEKLIFMFYDSEDLCFRDLRKKLDQNYNQQDEVMPSKYKGENCAWDYLKDTPLLNLEYIDQKVGLSDRMAHTMILGGSGSGKTNMIEYIIGQDLLDYEGTVVVLDSQVQIIPKLANLDIPIDDVTYLNPRWDIGLNLFDVGYSELMSGNDAETAINKAVGLIRFVLEGTLSSPMTDRQRTMFDYAIQLIISIPGGNILTFIELLNEDGHLAYQEQINKFDPVTQEFFNRDWGSDDYKRTREAVRARLMTLLKNPTFRRLFSSTENNFRVYDELQVRSLILLDTNKPTLDTEASSFLGRLYIAMIVQAAHRRFDNSGQQYRPVYLFIDEAQEYFDTRIAEMLEQARKANIGLILAHQTISQIKRAGLDPATVIGNTATKIVSTSYMDDARDMAKSMRIKKEALMELPQYTFGMYNQKSGFVSVRAPEHGLAAFEFREDKDELQSAMEARYKSSAVAPAEAEATATEDVETENTADADTQQKEDGPKSNGSGGIKWDDDFDLDEPRPI